MSAFAARQKLWGVSSGDVSVRSQSQGPNQETKGSPLPSRIATKSWSLPPSRASKRQIVDVKPSTPQDGQPEGRDVAAPMSPGAKTIVQYSTFRPDKQRKNYQQKPDGRTLLRLGEGERLVILGSFGIKVKEGEITVSGALLNELNAVQWIHAPHCHAVPVLRASSPAVVELQPHPAAPSLRQLARLNPVFGKLWNESSSTSSLPTNSTFQIVYTSEDAPKRTAVQVLSSPAEWNKKLAGLVKANLQGNTPVIFLCGPKSSGKSTFGRLLANRLITDYGDSNKKAWASAAILDIDPGQPEYGPPGVISLNKLSAPNLAPSFCHPTLKPTNGQLKSHAVAAITPAQDPSHYVECTLDLHAHYRATLGPKCPVIINTPGWIQGTGLDILSSLVHEIRPTEVIYMSQDGPEETVDALKSVCAATTTPFTTLPSHSTTNTSRTANDFRTMQTLSYFHLNYPSLTTPTPTWNPNPLTTLRPWCVRYRAPSNGILGILCYDHQPGPSLLSEAITGMILALVQISFPSALRDLLFPYPSSEMDIDTLPESLPGITLTPEGLPLIQNPQGRTLDPRYSRALGLVLIRGIDTAKGHLQLLTPLPGDVLTEAQGKDLVLVAGKFDTPSWAYAEDLYLRAFSTGKGTASGG
ncbi:polynucleotide 5'-hydroxyl-kinase grc3, partial [Podospora aff. communis PSN243]